MRLTLQSSALASALLLGAFFVQGLRAMGLPELCASVASRLGVAAESSWQDRLNALHVLNGELSALHGRLQDSSLPPSQRPVLRRELLKKSDEVVAYISGLLGEWEIPFDVIEHSSQKITYHESGGKRREFSANYRSLRLKPDFDTDNYTARAAFRILGRFASADGDEANGAVIIDPLKGEVEEFDALKSGKNVILSGTRAWDLLDGQHSDLVIRHEGRHLMMTRRREVGRSNGIFDLVLLNETGLAGQEKGRTYGRSLFVEEIYVYAKQLQEGLRAFLNGEKKWPWLKSEFGKEEMETHLETLLSLSQTVREESQRNTGRS